MVEVAQRRQAQLDHAVAAAALEIGDEGHAAGVVLEARVVEALLGRQHQVSVFRERWIGQIRSRALRWDDVGPLQVGSTVQIPSDQGPTLPVWLLRVTRHYAGPTTS